MRLGSTVKNWGPRKLLSLKSFSNKGMGVMLDPPKLLCQHCLIHQTEFLKTDTTCAPRLANPIPINIMHFSNPLVMTPPEVPCYSIHLIANTLRTRKQEKVYKGKEWSTEFMRVARPACESSLAFHPWSSYLSFSTRKLKSATLLPLNLKLRPRYLEGTWTKYMGLWFMNKFKLSEVLIRKRKKKKWVR